VRTVSPQNSRLLILAAALLFSTGGAVIKASTLSGWQIASGRSLVAALVLWWLLPTWRRPRNAGTFAVGAAYAATLVLYVVANKLTTAANAIFLQTTAPLYLIVLAPRLLGERTRASDLVLAAVLGCGLALFFVQPEAALRTAPDPALGNLLAAASGLTWAFAVLGLRWLARSEPTAHADPVGAAVVVGNGLAFLVCLPFVFGVFGTLAAAGDLDAATLSGGPRDWLLVLYLGAFQIGLAYVFLTRGIRGVRALEASLLLLLEPVANALLAWVVHAERPGAWSLAGCLLIGVGVVAHTLRQRDARAE
jgi:drug/metabolite transporter (DMT)-like permease